MFTGLIETTGVVTAVERGDKSRILTIRALITQFELAIGDSVATNGVCLTVEKFTSDTFTVRAISETVDRTTTGDLQVGDVVNLERAMKASARFDGHIVQGHVDTIATLIRIEQAGDSFYYTFQPDQKYLRYIAEKGSVAIDGISLTVARVDSTTFTLALIPHTIKMTALSNRTRGSRVNVECDVLARYIEQLMKYGVQKQSNDSELLNMLERNGF